MTYLNGPPSPLFACNTHREYIKDFTAPPPPPSPIGNASLRQTSRSQSVVSQPHLVRPSVAGAAQCLLPHLGLSRVWLGAVPHFARYMCTCIHIHAVMPLDSAQLCIFPDQTCLFSSCQLAVSLQNISNIRVILPVVTS